MNQSARGAVARGHGLRRAAALSVGVVAGAQLGARKSLHLSGRVIQLLLALPLAALAIRLLIPGEEDRVGSEALKAAVSWRFTRPRRGGLG